MVLSVILLFRLCLWIFKFCMSFRPKPRPGTVFTLPGAGAYLYLTSWYKELPLFILQVLERTCIILLAQERTFIYLLVQGVGQVRKGSKRALHPDPILYSDYRR